MVEVCHFNTGEKQFIIEIQWNPFFSHLRVGTHLWKPDDCRRHWTMSCFSQVIFAEVILTQVDDILLFRFKGPSLLARKKAFRKLTPKLRYTPYFFK